MMKATIFKDAALQQRFDRDGYVVMPFLDAAQVDALKEQFYSLHSTVPNGFYTTASNTDDNFKQQIRQHTERVMGGKVDSTFDGIRKLGSSFLSKAPGPDSKMIVHQDWTAVDEKQFYTATIWIPLVDTNEENGAMRVLPGSHLFFDTLRGATIDVVFKGHDEELYNAMVSVPMKAGEAIVFNHALIHASAANTSNKERIALAYGMVPQDAQLLFYYKNDQGLVEQFNMPDEMFLKYPTPGTRPTFGEKVAEFPYEVKPVSALKLHHLLAKSTRERKMKPLFKDQTVQEFFEKEGYAKLPVLDQNDVNTLREFYQTLGLQDQGGHGFHVSMDAVDKSLVEKILAKIYEVALPKASAHFQDAKPFVASFVIKEANPKSVVPVHQDWTFVEDEEQYCSVTCWIPLVDVDMDNGALGVVRGSHKFFSSHRPSPSPQVPSPISEHMFTIFPYLQLIELKAGEALIFDNRTFHGSPPNTTSLPRVAFGIGFTQKDAKLVHYYLKPGTKDTVLKYEIDEPFFRKYENAKLSKMYDAGEVIEGYKLVGEGPYILPKFTSNELVELIKENGNEFNVPMCEKLATLFNMSMDGSGNNQMPNAYGNSEQQEEKASEPELVEVVYDEWENRPFYKKYSPLNVVREIKNRLVGS